MRFFDSLDVPPDLGPAVVTFGKFDGIHLGHRRMLDSLVRIAAERGIESAVLTFDRNPLALLDPARCPDAIVSSDQKRELLEQAGVDTMVQVPFDRAFAATPAEEFVERALVNALHARVVLLGPDTRFGAGGRGDASTLVELGARYGFEVMHVDAYSDGERVSSTRIRHLLAAGDVAAASRLLGRNPSVRGMVVRGQQRGRQLGYPTANLSPDLEGFIPADGVYAGFLTIHSADTDPDPARLADPRHRMPAAISIGNNPTFEGVPAKQVEAHVLDADLDLYDRTVVVEFVDFVRGMVKFDSLDGLITQMGRDTDRVREILAATPAAS